MEYVIGIDVGTGSVRGALVDKQGKLIKSSAKSITTWNPRPDFYQQSSTEIWSFCCSIIKNLIQDVSPESIKGIGFDATCSLAVLDSEGNPLSVDINGNKEQDIILWMDHRAKVEAEDINATNHPILKFVGGNVSPEMMVPKILWLKRNNSNCYRKAEHFFLLPDFLTWKSTGEETRSLCSLVCKCNYEASFAVSEWPKDFFEALDLSELADDNWKRIGSKVSNPGDLCGKLTSKAAEETGLLEGTPVGISLIDAHAGGIGLLGCKAEGVSQDFTSRICLIMGTSTCHMWQTGEEDVVPGVWGPYYNAMVPSLWLFEGGQSASGKLIDHIIEIHPRTKKIKEKIGSMQITEYLNNILELMSEELQLNSFDELTKNIHVWPDFHGNRSPIADPNMTGLILGMKLAAGEKNLALMYLATVQALAYGTKHIIEALEKHSNKMIDTILICGGLSKNRIFVQTHANALGKPVLVPDEPESVLLGSAILGATACKFYPDLTTAMLNMAGNAALMRSEKESNISEFHSKKYDVFLELLNCQLRCRQLMS